ncbi:hypothetical protein EZV62_006864 [Acer yangbiense]|uniref:RNase H type-1 domain-containing protein n=1 Tax=Acer yangbiense TaxID=1000413 RepID=A0A5C7IA14_9ROSI|nr:hypothetical protein EZV62_006864 [Acer yangbiense]
MPPSSNPTNQAIVFIIDSYADNLAKKGSNKEGDVIQWGVFDFAVVSGFYSRGGCDTLFVFDLFVLNIQIVSDSSVAVSWANSTDNFGSLPHVQIIYDIRGYLQSLNGLSIVHNLRASNDVADALAKLASGGGFRFYNGKKLFCSSQGFRRLEILKLDDNDELEEYVASRGRNNTKAERLEHP